MCYFWWAAQFQLSMELYPSRRKCEPFPGEWQRTKTFKDIIVGIQLIPPVSSVITFQKSFLWVTYKPNLHLFSLYNGEPLQQKSFVSETDSSSEAAYNSSAFYRVNTFSPTQEKFKALNIVSDSSPSPPKQAVCSTAERYKAKHVTAYGCVVKLQMCREIVVLPSYPGEFPQRGCAQPRAFPLARPTHGWGPRGVGQSSSTGRRRREARAKRDLSLKDQNSSVQPPALHAPGVTLNYTRVLHSHCIRSPDMSKTELIRANLKQPNIIASRCARHDGVMRHKHFMSAFPNKCIRALLRAGQKFHQHAVRLNHLAPQSCLWKLLCKAAYGWLELHKLVPKQRTQEQTCKLQRPKVQTIHGNKGSYLSSNPLLAWASTC